MEKGAGNAKIPKEIIQSVKILYAWGGDTKTGRLKHIYKNKKWRCQHWTHVTALHADGIFPVSSLRAPAGNSRFMTKFMWTKNIPQSDAWKKYISKKYH